MTTEELARQLDEEIRNLFLEFMAEQGWIMSNLFCGFPTPKTDKIPPLKPPYEPSGTCKKCGRSDDGGPDECVCWHNDALDAFDKFFVQEADTAIPSILRPYIERLEKLEAALQHISDSVQPNDDPSAICCAHIADEALKGADHE